MENDFLSQIKQPPSSIQAEQNVIGAIMLDNNTLDDVLDIVKPEDFYWPQHRDTIDSMIFLRDGGKPIDIVTLSEILDVQKGGITLADLAEIAKNTASSRNAAAYAKIVKQKSVERKIITVSRDIADMAFQKEMPTEQKLELAETQILGIREVKEGDVEIARDVLRRVIDDMQIIHDQGGEIHGTESGFVDIDKRTRGFKDGDLVVIGGRPSMGKTTFAMNIAEHNAIKKGLPVMVFSLEMPSDSLIKRCISSISGIEFELIQSAGVLDSTEQCAKLGEASNEIARAPLIIDDTPALNINQIKARARKAKRQYPNMALIVVDYLQLVRCKADSREREIAEISGQLKALAKELELPIIALCQLSRNLENRNDKRPINSDLRESGAIEQDADIIMFLYRDEVYNELTTEKNVAHVITRKFRNGKIGTDFLSTEFDRIRFQSSTYRSPEGAAYTPKINKGTFNYDD